MCGGEVMEKVILIVHGMRKGELNQKLIQFVDQLFEGDKLNYDIAFLESETKDLNTTLTKHIRQGADTLYLVPLLLFSASHYYEDIVVALEKWQAQYPNIAFHLTKPLGTHPKMETWARYRIEEMERTSGQNVGVVLLAHGSERFNEPDLALTRIANQLSTAHETCYPSMVYGALDFKTRLLQIAQQHDSLCIVPFFLFDGFLVQRTKAQIRMMQLPCEVKFTNAINFHPILKEIILSRLFECRGGVPCIQYS